MYRLFAILLALGLVGAMVGCNHTHGVCDCDLGPIGHTGPPVLAPGMSSVRLEPIPAMPKPVEKTVAAPASERLEKTTPPAATEPVDITTPPAATETPK